MSKIQRNAYLCIKDFFPSVYIQSCTDFPQQRRQKPTHPPPENHGPRFASACPYLVTRRPAKVGNALEPRPSRPAKDISPQYVLGPLRAVVGEREGDIRSRARALLAKHVGAKSGSGEKTPAYPFTSSAPKRREFLSPDTREKKFQSVARHSSKEISEKKKRKENSATSR